jgi:hypothetical protein
MEPNLFLIKRLGYFENAILASSNELDNATTCSFHILAYSTEINKKKPYFLEAFDNITKI